jgi:hypothetical protein
MSFITKIGSKVTQLGDVLKDSYGPLAPLEPKNKEAATLRYPMDVGQLSTYPHSLEIWCWQPDPDGELLNLFEPDGSLISLTEYQKRNNILIDQTKLDGGAIATSANNQFRDLLTSKGKAKPPKINRNQLVNGERISDWTRRGSLEHVIALYLPAQALQEVYQNDYADVSMTEAMGALGAIVEAGATGIEAIKQGDWSVLRDVFPFVARDLIGRGLGGGAETVTEALIQAGGYATNPQIEMLYKGTKFRSFDFRFEFLPRSQKEADQVREIIRKLKYHAAPEYRSGQGRYLIPPSFFDLYIRYGDKPNDRIPLDISTCVLTGIDVDMTNGTDQYASYVDGSPIQMAMQLRFTELEIMTKQLRLAGY